MSDNEIEMSDSTLPAAAPTRYARPRRGLGNLWHGAAPSARSISGSIPLGSRSASSSSASTSGSGSTAEGVNSGSLKKPTSNITANASGSRGKEMYGLPPPPSTSSTSSTAPPFSPAPSTAKLHTSSPPNSSRRSSLANLVHNLDMSDNEVEHLTVLPEDVAISLGGGEGEEDDEDDESGESDEEGEGVPGELEYVDAEEGYEGGLDGGIGIGAGAVVGGGGVGGGAEDEDESSSDEDESESSDEDEDEEDPNAVHSTESKPNSSVTQKPPKNAHTLSIPNLTGLTNGTTPASANGSPIHVDGSAQQATPISLSTPSQTKYISGPGVPPPSSSSVLTSPPTSSPSVQATPSTSTSLVAPTPPPGASTPSSPAELPPSTAPAGETSSTATVKPPKGKEKDKEKAKGKGKKHRTPSPSPPPIVPPPPITTIRLELKLGGPSNYEVDVARRAKETGQRAWSPEPPAVVIPEVVVDLAPVEGGDGDGGAGGIGGEGGEGEGEGAKKRKRKKKSIAQEYYDTSDPFIDDSELAVDQRTYFAQTKQQGFYVSSGEVALLKDPSHKSPKKPKSKKPGMGGSLSVASGGGKGKAGLKANGDGTRDSPIALVDEDEHGHGHGEGGGGASARETLYGVISKGIRGVGLLTSSGMIGHGAGAMKVEMGGNAGGPGKDGFGYGAGMSVSAPPGGGRSAGGGGVVEVEEEGDEKAGMKRKRYITVVEGGKKRKIVNVNSFHPDLQAAIDLMKASISAENWEQKGKFPPGLKPKLGELAVKAIKLDEYDDHFFNLMPVLFPYNKFTMTKLIKRTVYADHVALLLERQDELLKQLEDLAKAGFARAEEEYQKSLLQWTARQEKLKLEAGGGAAGEGASADGSNAPTRHPTEERDKDAMDVEMPAPSQAGPSDKKEGAAGEKKEKDHPPPSRRYRLTEQMRGIIWDLVLLSNEACRLENEKNSYEGSVIQVSEQGGRKVLYQKIVAAFPEGWMSSGQISRDVSAMKKRFEKEAMEMEES